MTDRYFLLSPSPRSKVAVACAPATVPPAYRLIADLAHSSELPFELALKNILFTKERTRESTDLSELEPLWLDYQPNSLAWPLFSERFKLLIDDLTQGQDYFEWLTATVRQNSRLTRRYFVLRFTKELDVLDRQRSVFAGKNADFLVKPVFDRAKVAQRLIFNASEDNWQITCGLYVSQVLRKAAVKQKLLGLHFEELGPLRFS